MFSSRNLVRSCPVLSTQTVLTFKVVRNKDLKNLIIDNFFCHLMVMKLCIVIELETYGEN